MDSITKGYTNKSAQSNSEIRETEMNVDLDLNLQKNVTIAMNENFEVSQHCNALAKNIEENRQRNQILTKYRRI